MTTVQEGTSLKLVSWNLRYDCVPDNIPVAETLANLPGPLVEPKYSHSDHERPWSTRRIKVAQILRSRGVALAGFQEVLKRQVEDVQQLLGPETWEYAGVARNDGRAKGEFNPIFYDKTCLNLLSTDTFWLSDTPFRPSKHPDAGCHRICTVARLQFSGAPQRTLTLLNTHLDHRSDVQRRLGASLVLARARYEAVTTQVPVFVTGDFNSSATGADSGAYDIITGKTPPVSIDPAFEARYSVPDDDKAAFCMHDTRARATPLSVAGNFATFSGFAGEWVPMGRIDFVFGNSGDAWSLWQYDVPSVLSDDGVLASDHRPVFVDVLLHSGIAGDGR